MAKVFGVSAVSIEEKVKTVKKKKKNKEKERHGRMDNVENVITMVYRNRKENEKKKVK